jgi:hypothetical protein
MYKLITKHTQYKKQMGEDSSRERSDDSTLTFFLQLTTAVLVHKNIILELEA